MAVLALRPLLGALLIAVAAAAPAQPVELIKFATLAPEGSTWMQVMRDYERAVKEESGGRLQFRMFPGGVSGPEEDALRKVRFGQLDAVALTGAGLGLLVPEERILDGALLYRTEAEVDAVYRRFTPELERLFEQRGFMVLGWAEVGFVYFFTTKRAPTVDELARLKLWAWEGDPVAGAMFAAVGVAPIPLQVADVLPSLQTGVIDGVYASPLALLALQWFTRLNYQLDLPLGNASGALIIARRRFDALEPDLQEILVRNGRHFMSTLQQRSRADNARALQTLARRGIESVPLAPAEVQILNSAGARARQALVPEQYPQELLDRVHAELAELRAAR